MLKKLVDNVSGNNKTKRVLADGKYDIVSVELAENGIQNKRAFPTLPCHVEPMLIEATL